MTHRKKSRTEPLEIRVERKLRNFIGFWEVCNQKPCRRARACVGDLNACHQRHWPHASGASFDSPPHGEEPREAWRLEP